MRLIHILRAMQIWLVLAGAFFGCILIGGTRVNWNQYWLFTIACWFVLDVYWILTARNVKPIMPARGNHLALWSMVLIYALYCLPLSSVPLLGQPAVPRYAVLEGLGAFLCAFGVGFAIRARYVLAESWNAAVPLKEGHALIQKGPYALVRHPIYFGFLMAALGMILALGEVRALILLVGVGILLNKMTQEENILRAAYPRAYAEYEQKTKRLLPWIW